MRVAVALGIALLVSSLVSIGVGKLIEWGTTDSPESKAGEPRE